MIAIDRSLLFRSSVDPVINLQKEAIHVPLDESKRKFTFMSSSKNAKLLVINRLRLP